MDILLGLILICIIIAFTFFVKTSNLTQKVISLDSMGIMVISLLCLLSVSYKESFYIDVAFVFGLISFIGVIVYARFNLLRGEDA